MAVLFGMMVDYITYFARGRAVLVSRMISCAHLSAGSAEDFSLDCIRWRLFRASLRRFRSHISATFMRHTAVCSSRCRRPSNPRLRHPRATRVHAAQDRLAEYAAGDAIADLQLRAVGHRPDNVSGSAAGAFCQTAGTGVRHVVGLRRAHNPSLSTFELPHEQPKICR